MSDQRRDAEAASDDERHVNVEAAGDDTEGHSMLTYELGLQIERERKREAERASRDARRTGPRDRRGFIDRLRRR